MDKAREIALKALYEIEEKNAYSNLVLDEILINARKTWKEMSKKDVGFISEIVYGTVSWKLTIDEIIKKYSKIKMKKISTWILNILRMSIYQIIFLDKVPKSAAVNEAVKLAKRYGHKASSNFVNAVLRKIEKKDYEEFFSIKDSKERISKTTSMPLWLVTKLIEEKGEEKAQTICNCSNLKPKLSVRVNTLKSNVSDIKKELETNEIYVEKGEIEDFLILEGAKNIEKIKTFQEGKITIQDEAAGLVAKILNPSPKDKVLDACSSPGGKTTYLAQLMQNKGQIIAWDIYEHRVKLVNTLALRLGISNIETQVKDASKYEEKYFEYFDKILLDVPCLGLGVLKRKPDIKWKKTNEDINEITSLQMSILNTCSLYLKRGGELVYSTCSILKEENENIIENFLKNNQEFKIQKIELEKQSFFNKFLQPSGVLQVYQNERTDGFFITKLIKKK